MPNRLAGFRRPTTVSSAFNQLVVLRDMLNGLPHPDDAGLTLWSLYDNDWLLSREEVEPYDRVMEGIFAVLGDATYDIAMLLNAEKFDR